MCEQQEGRSKDRVDLRVCVCDHYKQLEYLALKSGGVVLGFFVLGFFLEGGKPITSWSSGTDQMIF